MSQQLSRVYLYRLTTTRYSRELRDNTVMSKTRYKTMLGLPKRKYVRTLSLGIYTR